MKLSFVIPAHNEEHYLGKCLDSIFRELEGKNYDTEIIVVNNASTDGTEKLARSYPGVIVINEIEKGIVKARLAGLNASTGELIANIDSDSILTPGWVEKVLYEFNAHKNLVALSGPFIYYDIPKKYNKYVRLFYSAGYLSHLINRAFKIGAMLQGGNFVIKKSAIMKAGGYNTNLSFYGEDTDIAVRLVKQGLVKFTFKLPMYTSGRRLVHEGGWTMVFKYALNHIWITFLGKPFSKEYLDIRKK